MRTYLQLLFALLITSVAFGQISFKDDFESYNVGDGIAASSSDWELWPSAAAEDAEVSDDQSVSGSNALRLPGGQDIDIILPFQGQYESGTFDMSMDIYIPNGRNAYFNFQGNDDIAGATGLWVLQCYFRTTGIFEVDNGGAGALVIQNAYPQDEWINVRLNVNLTENLWRMYINDECLGSFVNDAERNRINALNLYPDDGNALSYVDNVEFSHTDEADPVNIVVDAAYGGGVDIDAEIGNAIGSFFGIAGTEQTVGLNIGNAGTANIESFTVTLETANQSISKDVTMNIAPGTASTVVLDEKILFNTGDQFAQFNVSNINGVTDDNTCNNSAPMLFRGFTPANDKKVFVEESTGRGCTFCPRGHVYMNYMANKYPDHFVGAAVHTDDFGIDPMTNNLWDEGLTTITSQPSIIIDRDTNLIINPASVEAPFITSVTTAPLMTLKHEGKFDETSRKLDVNVITDFTLIAIKTNTRLFVGLTEDGVTGTGDLYAQTNAYSGGGLGPMGGYENLPSPVPAEQMVYNDVARLNLTPGVGLEDAYVNTVDRSILHSFSGVIPADWNLDNMHIVSAFMEPDGTIGNCQKTSVREAIANGYTLTIDPVLDQGISVFPNPTSGLTNISLEFDIPTAVTLDVTDSRGKIISREDYGTVSGKQTVSFDGSGLTAGIYNLNFRSGNNSTIKRLMITE